MLSSKSYLICIRKCILEIPDTTPNPSQSEFYGTDNRKGTATGITRRLIEQARIDACCGSLAVVGIVALAPHQS